MQFRVGLFLFLLDGAIAQLVCPDVPATGCSVCGDGQCITNPDAIFVNPIDPTVMVPCGDLQQAGLEGAIDPVTECPLLINFVGVCECMPGSTAPAPVNPVTPAPVNPVTPAPVNPVTPAPVNPVTPAPVDPVTPAPVDPVTPAPVPIGQLVCPDVPATGCSICGDGLCITNPDAIFVSPIDPTVMVPCGDLQQAGLEGAIDLVNECPVLPGLIGVCGCMPEGSPTGAPVGIMPTPAPTIGIITPMPSSAPTIGMIVPTAPDGGPSERPDDGPDDGPSERPDDVPTPSPDQPSLPTDYPVFRPSSGAPFSGKKMSGKKAKSGKRRRIL